MKLTIFQSQQGDSILISSNDKHILVDGGMSASYQEHVAPTLGDLRVNDKQLDLVCVSHIDQDHIQGVLSMLDDEIDWRVYEYQKGIGNNRVKKPNSIRPPKIVQIWHNAFHEQVQDNNGRIEDLLAAFSMIFADGEVRDKLDREVSSHATSIRQAILLSRRIQAKQLNIPLNEHFNGKLITTEQVNKDIQIGDLVFSIIGPGSKDMDKLKKEWNEWLNENDRVLKRIQRNARKDEQEIGNASIPWLGVMLQLAQELGHRNKVTIPNLASIMFLIENNVKSILMTGDGHWKDILDGLKSKKKLAQNGSIHLDILKVQHHGSEHNLNDEFCRKVTADNYIFCGDGSHHNPDLRVVKAIIDSRVSNGGKRAITDEVGNEFTFWFNSSAKVTRNKNKEYMEELEQFVKDEALKYSQFKFQFMPKNKSKYEIVL